MHVENLRFVRFTIKYSWEKYDGGHFDCPWNKSSMDGQGPTRYYCLSISAIWWPHTRDDLNQLKQ